MDPYYLTYFYHISFFIVDDIELASYSDNNTPSVRGKCIEEVIQSLEETSNVLFKWFLDNLMKINAGKRHLVVSTSHKVNIRIGFPLKEKLFG